MLWGLTAVNEGTRSVTGEVRPFKIGVAVLAIERRVPVIPVYIHRAFDLLRKGQRFIRPGKVTVTFGQPMYPPGDEETGDRYEGFRAFAKQVERAVMSLRDEARV